MHPLTYSVLAGALFLAACGDNATSPGANLGKADGASDGTYATCNASPPSDLFPAPSPTQPRAILWFFDAAVRRGPLNLCIDGWRGYKDWPKLSAGGGLFMKNSSVPHTLTVTATGDSTVLASTQMTFAADTQYAVVFTPRDSLIVLYDTVSTPPPGEQSFRLVNVASGAVDVYVTTGSGMPAGSDTLPRLTPAVSNLAPDAVSPYLSFPAVPTRIIITAAGDPSTVLHETGTGGANSAGQVWTVLFGEMYGDSLQVMTDWHQDRGPVVTVKAEQQWDVPYLAAWHLEARGSGPENLYLISCHAGTTYGDSTGTGGPSPALTLTFRQSGPTTLEGTASPVRLRCVSQNHLSGPGEVSTGWDSTLAGGPISGRIVNDSLIITHAEWRIAGFVLPAGGAPPFYFGPSAQGPYMLGVFCMSATVPCFPGPSPDQQPDYDKPYGFVAMTRVD